VWIVESFGSAVSESFYNAASHQIGDRWSLEAIAWWQRAVAALFICACALAWHDGLPPMPEARFWAPAACSVTLNACASLLYVRALREDLSLTVPITALSPVFLLLTEPLLTGRTVPPSGMLGVAVIGAGLYLLNWPVLRALGPIGPIRNVWRQRGTRMMLGVVAIWAVTAPLDGMAVRVWDPLWYAAFLHGGIGLLLTPLCWRKPQAIAPARRDRLRLGSLGLLSGFGSMLQMTAMASAPATFVIAIRRFSAPLSALWGALFFKEPHVRTRLLGAVVMAAGAILLALH
jgi:drug/metabolite transporter (DMT)-like permease